MPAPMDLPPLYVVNLDRQPERWERLRAALAHQGLIATRVAAVDALRDLPRDHGAGPPSGGGLTPSEVACILSHRVALTQFLASAAPWGLILEDDACFDARLPGLLAGELGRWMVCCDILKLEGVPSDYASATGPRLATSPLGTVIIPPRPTLGSAAYAITRQGAARLLARCTAMTAPFDHMLIAYEQHRIAYGEVRPWVVWQAAGPSGIAKAGRPEPRGLRAGGGRLWRGLCRASLAAGWMARACLRTGPWSRAADYWSARL